MRIRIGYGLGTQTVPGGMDGFGALVDHLERVGFDSLWLSERITGGAPDPIVALAYAAGRTRRLKLGTSVMVLPGRNPVLVAKQLATLDALSQGRLLPAVGLGVADGREQQAFGVARAERAAWFDEALPLMRRLWTEDAVDHPGPLFPLEAMSIHLKPCQHPLEVWLGGRAPSELRRIGRVGDGWLASFTTPAEAGAGRRMIEDAAGDAGRRIDSGHFGAMIPYAGGPIPDPLRAGLAARRPGVDPDELVVSGLDRIGERVAAYAEHGLSKFVLVPVSPVTSWADELEAVASASRAALPS